MPVIISLLRGINVGGHNLIRMEALRELYQSLGLDNPKSYVQSGNIVFRTAARAGAAQAARISDAIQKQYGFRPEVILRDAAEMRQVVERNPFKGRKDLEPAKLAVNFIASEPGNEARGKLEALSSAGYPEELHMDGRHLYMYFPNGMGRPKLPLAQIERAIKIPCTARNWNTVTKLLAMAEELDD